MTVAAVVMPGPGRPLEERRFPAPRPEPGGAVLETVASEVCGTDVHLHHGRLAGVPYPIIPGHVNCGRVLETNGPLLDVEGRRVEAGRGPVGSHATPPDDDSALESAREVTQAPL